MNTQTPPERFALVIADIGDPAHRQGLHERDAAYRLRGVLKALLRGYGFRCVRVAPHVAEDARSGAETAMEPVRGDRAAERTPGGLKAMAGPLPEPAMTA